MEDVNANLQKQLTERKNAKDLSVESSEQECTKCREHIDIQQNFKQLHENYTKLKMFVTKLS